MFQFGQCWLTLALLAGATAMLYVFAPISSLIGAGAILFTLYFFRDPERIAPVGDVIVSPADGRVLEVVRGRDPYVGDCWRVAVFMGPFDVHVNRAPASGTIASVTHTPGRKVKAYLMGDLDARERNRIEFEGEFRFSMTQYAGIFARRIVCFKKVGDKVLLGGRVGMIKFGSRADVVYPGKFRPTVGAGDIVFAGKTVVGVLDGKV